MAAFYPLAFAAAQVGGTKVTVRNLTPPGVEPHDLEVSPSDVQAVRSADLVFLLPRLLRVGEQGVRVAERVEQPADGAVAEPLLVESRRVVVLVVDDPPRFDHKVVRVAGTVTHSIGVMGYGGYQINDGSGTLTVVSQEGGAPREGAKVGVQGEFRSAFTLGTESVAVLMEKQRFTP